MLHRCTVSVFLVSLLAAATAQAADIFPVKAYTKPDEAIVVRFVNEKGEEGKKAVAELGVAAGKLDLFTAAPATEIATASGAPLFKVYSATGEEQKFEVGGVKPSTDGTVDLSAAYPKLKEGGTFFVTWKDAPPLVIETLFNTSYPAFKAKIQSLSGDEKKAALERFGPMVTHMELAEYAVITTDKGVIKAKFAYDDAPHTIDNYISLARQGFYDDSAFHRVIFNFMIQGGDSYANTAKAGQGGPGYDVPHEFSDKKHLRGVLSMARSSGDMASPTGKTITTAEDTAGSQFFIMHGDSPNLDGGYTAFGDVFEGMNVVDAIAKTPTSDNNGTVKGDRPKIVSIRILPATAEIYRLKK